jgi:diguanylate cyclase (GGDEF)-like protein
VAACIRAQLRSQDLAARVGGDEFAALLRGLSHVDDARVVAERLATTIAAPIRADDTEVVCPASVGLAYTEGDEQVPVLVRRADTALYAAKEQGKGRWAEYNPEQRATARRTPDGQPTARERNGA